jgi:hypothetical protein
MVRDGIDALQNSQVWVEQSDVVLDGQAPPSAPRIWLLWAAGRF